VKADPTSSWRVPALALLLAVLVGAGYSQALHGEWLNWDDPQNFLENYAWRGLGPEQLGWMFTSFHLGHWNPVTWMSLGLDHVLWGMDPFGYRLTNVLLQAVAALLLFAVGRRVLALGVAGAEAWRVDLAAFFGALFFAVHPLRVESVAWITERRDVLSGVFFFATLWCWLRYAAPEPGRPLRHAYALALGCFVLALLSKTSTVILPVVLVVLDFWPLRRASGWGFARRLLEKAPFFALSLVMGGIAIFGQRGVAGVMASWQDHGLASRLVQEGFTALFFLYKTCAPTGLLPLYPLPPYEHFFEPPYLIRAAIALGLTLTILGAARRAPGLAVAWVLFLVGLFLTGGIFQAGPQVVADRYSYLACYPLGFVVAGVLLLHPWALRLPREVALATLTLAALTLITLTSLQAQHWTSSRALWEYADEQRPDTPLVLSSLGHVRMMDTQLAGDPQEKRLLFEQARDLFQRYFELTDDPRGLINMAEALQYRADFAAPGEMQTEKLAALELADRAVALGEQRGTVLPGWYGTRGGLLVQLGRFDRAAPDLERLVAARPDDIQARVDLGVACIGLGRAQDALLHLKYVVEREPRHARAWLTAGYAHMALEKKDEARRAFQRTLAILGEDLGPAAEAEPFARAAREALAILGG